MHVHAHTHNILFLPASLLLLTAETTVTAHTTTTCNTRIIHSQFVEAKSSAGRWRTGLRPDFMIVMVCKPHLLLIRFFRHRYHLLADLGAPVCGTVLALLSRQSRGGPPIKTAPDWSNMLFGLF